MNLNENSPKSHLVLSDQELSDKGQSLLGIGHLRRAVVGEGPGTFADLKRLNHDVQALSALALALARLESDGDVYTHGRNVYLWLRPYITLLDQDTSSVFDFYQKVRIFQVWLNAREQVVVEGTGLSSAGALSTRQRMAIRRLARVESVLGESLVAAYVRWLRAWITNRSTLYTIWHRDQKPVDLRIPPRVRVIPINGKDPAEIALQGSGPSSDHTYELVYIIRTVTGQTMYVDINKNTAHLRPGYEIVYSMPSIGSEAEVYVSLVDIISND